MASVRSRSALEGAALLPFMTSREPLGRTKQQPASVSISSVGAMLGAPPTRDLFKPKGGRSYPPASPIALQEIL